MNDADEKSQVCRYHPQERFDSEYMCTVHRGGGKIQRALDNAVSHMAKNAERRGGHVAFTVTFEDGRLLSVTDNTPIRTPIKFEPLSLTKADEEFNEAFHAVTSEIMARSGVPAEYAPNLRMELGKRYVTRDGRITEPAAETKALSSEVRAKYPFTVRIGRLEEFYKGNGSYDMGRQEMPYCLDLVREYDDETPMPPVIQGLDAQIRAAMGLQLEVGKRYVTRSGHVTEPMTATSSTLVSRKYPFSTTVNGGFHVFKANGSWNMNNADLPCDLDLVSEHVSAVTMKLPTSVPFAEVRFEVDRGPSLTACECGSEACGYTTHSTWCPKRS